MQKPREKNRKSPRLKYFDYSQPGSYFITICTKDREYFFGTVVNSNVILSDVGKIAYKFWYDIPDHFARTKLHAFVVMPNHIHGIIEIVDVGTRHVGTRHVGTRHVGTRHGASLPYDHENKFGPQPRGSISIIINQYKSSVKRWCNKNGFEHFQWQSRFYDHIIRDDDDFWRIHQYIVDNPKKWENDISTHPQAEINILRSDYSL